MKLKLIVSFAVLTFLFSNCRKNDVPGLDKKYPADVANAWMQLHIKLTRTTMGYNSVVSDRSFGYAGITLYESLVPGIPGGTSLLAQIGGNPV
nr:hypothetical protein [Bacteroidota bacterium]